MGLSLTPNSFLPPEPALLLTSRAVRQILGVAVVLLFAALSSSAYASEEPWHLGGGVGVATLKKAPIGPALSIHAAYELSDFFDLHVEVLASHHAWADPTTIGSASVGIEYKIDVFQWVPYVGLYAGLDYYDGRPGPHGEHGMLLGTSIGGGLDYLFSRSFAMGAAVKQHSSFREGWWFFLDDSHRTSLSILLRAEYRWGL